MKMRKFERGGFATSEDSEYNRDSLGDFIVKKDLDRVPVNEVADDEKVVTDDRIARTSPAAKTPIVTKEELAKSGLSLRDYMNKQQGLTRRGGATPAADTSTAYGKEQQYQRAQEAAQTPEGKAKRAAMEKSQAIEASYPEQALMGGAGFGIKSIAKAAQNLANRGGAKTAAKRLERPDPTFREKELEILKDIPRSLPAPSKLALPKPTPKLGYDKAGAKAAERGGRAEGRQAEMLKENARRSGLREDASAETLKAVRDKLGGDKFTVMKRGGSVQGYASGGAVSASRRGDGIAQRGKTRGRMC
jgi:hypothetical protein